MILKDIVDEYKFVYETLENCAEHFETAEKIINDYFHGVSTATSSFFNNSPSTDTTRINLTRQLSTVIDNLFSQITILVTSGYEFHGALKILITHEFKNQKLQELINDFHTYSHRVIDASSAILKAQLEGMKRKELLTALISPLQTTIKLYHTLVNLYEQFKYSSELLLEPLPNDISTNPDYESLNIQSLTPTKDMIHISDSLTELSELFENISRLDNTTTTSSKTYYLRKVETGSLLTAFVTTMFIVRTTVKLIDYCYPKFIQWQQLYYTNKETQLKLNKQELDAVKELLAINPDIENSDELLQTASARLFKYFKINPEFKVNNKNYKTNMDILLLQQKETVSE